MYERAKPGAAPPAGPMPDRPTIGAASGGGLPAIGPAGNPPRDPLKEIEQLREQLKRLEKELKERK